LASLSDDAHNSNVASIDALTDRSITKMNRVNQHDIKNATVMLGGSVPVIDGLAVRMVTDNYTDRYSIPLATPGIKVERVGATERVGVEPVMRQMLAGYRRAGTEDHHLGPQVAAHCPRDIAQPMGGL